MHGANVNFSYVGVFIISKRRWFYCKSKWIMVIQFRSMHRRLQLAFALEALQKRARNHELLLRERNATAQGRLWSFDSTEFV